MKVSATRITSTNGGWHKWAVYRVTDYLSDKVNWPSPEFKRNMVELADNRALILTGLVRLWDELNSDTTDIASTISAVCSAGKQAEFAGFVVLAGGFVYSIEITVYAPGCPIGDIIIRPVEFHQYLTPRDIYGKRLPDGRGVNGIFYGKPRLYTQIISEKEGDMRSFVNAAYRMRNGLNATPTIKKIIMRYNESCNFACEDGSEGSTGAYYRLPIDTLILAMH